MECRQNVFSDLYDIFKRKKLECVLIVIGTILSCVFFRYMDGESMTAWSLEVWDAFFRGGFTGYNEIIQQNLWNAPHGILKDQIISCALWGVWNMPVLLIHYIFNTGFALSAPIMLWSKLFLVIVNFAMGWLCNKIVFKITNDKKRSVIANILVCGAPTTILISIGYSMQDEILWLFCLIISLYEIVCGRKNRALLWMSVAVCLYPIAILFSISIVISSSKKFVEMICRALCLLGVTVLRAFLFPVTDGISQILQYFGRSNISVGSGNISIFTLILIAVYLFQFFIRCENDDENHKFMFFSLAAIALDICIFSWIHFYRFCIYVPFTIICILLVRSDKKMECGLFGICLIEFFQLIIACNNRWCLNFYYVSARILEGFGWENDDCIISIKELLEHMFPDLSFVSIVANGFVLACAIWVLWVSYPNNGREVRCLVPIKIVTTIWCSFSILAISLMCFVLAKIGIVYTDIQHDCSLAAPLTGQNCLEEYFCGKNASSIDIVVRPVTWERSYPSDQKVCLDIVKVDSGEVVGSTEWSANELGNNRLFTITLDEINIVKDEWYIFRLYCPKPIDNEEHYIYFLRSKSGTADPDRHYAIEALNTENGTEYVQADYDIISLVITK